MLAKHISSFVLGSRNFAACTIIRNFRSLKTLTQTTQTHYTLFKNTKCFMSSENKLKRPLYLDYQSTTPVDPRVLDAMLPFYIDMYGNPHSRTHALGWEAEHHVELARKKVAQLINASPREIIFTSGATEANNLALKGVAAFLQKSKQTKNHIITTQIEHKCVITSCRDIKDVHGWRITYLQPNSEGIVDLEKLKQAITPQTAIVSIMTVNNEIGVIQPIKEIGAICKEKNLLFHTDAAQACGKIPIDVKEMNIDLLSLSSHKLYGPKGVGALYIKQRKPRTRIVPLFSGGGQERGLRSGTLPTPLIVGFGEACQIGLQEMERDRKRSERLAKRLYDKISSNLSKVILNGSLDQRYKGNLNLSFTAVEGESLLMQLKDVAISSGSACTSASLEPSYVLHAIGVGEDLAHTSLRFGIGRFTTEQEIDKCADLVVEKVNKLREMSPLWETDDSVSEANLLWT